MTTETTAQEITITFEAQDNQTLLTLHTRFASAERLQAAAEAGFVIGWETTLERMADYLKTEYPPKENIP